MEQRVTPPTHDCRKTRKELKATIEAPYHFVDSGLPNVYLSGIRVFACSVCERLAAEIPAIEELMSALARAIVQKNSPLTGVEVRFLRKRLGVKAIDFSAVIDVSPEQLSRWENGHNALSGSLDRFIRLVYAFMSGDSKLKALVQKVETQFHKWSTSIHGSGPEERITAEYKANRKWVASSVPIAA